MNEGEKAVTIAAMGYIAVLIGEYATIQSVALSLQFVGIGIILLMFLYAL